MAAQSRLACTVKSDKPAAGSVIVNTPFTREPVPERKGAAFPKPRLEAL